MTPPTDLLARLASHLGSALAFADDASQAQNRLVGSHSTRAALNANARSYAIGALRRTPIEGYRLAEQHTELNKVELRQIESATRFWLKSETAVNFTFEKAEPLFTFPSDWHVLTFHIDCSEVDFKCAAISRLKNKRYKLESALEFQGRFPLGGVVPPGGYPPSRATGIFEDGSPDDFRDLFDEKDDAEQEDGNDAGEASA